MFTSPVIDYSHRFMGNVWNLIPIEDRGQLIIEVRDTKEHRVDFMRFDLRSKTMQPCTWEGRETWWTGALWAQGDRLLLQEFHDTENPEDKSLIGLDLKHMTVVWKHKGLDFMEICQEKVLCSSQNGWKKTYSLVDIVTGEKTGTNSEHLPRLLRQNEVSTRNNRIGHPLHYIEGHDYFSTVQAFIQSKTSKIPVKGIEYLEYSDMKQFGSTGMLISYYTMTEGGLANFLIALDKEGKVLMEDTLGTNLKGVGLGTFFTLSGYLIYMKEKKEIVVY